ncbi:calcium-binding protein [Salipiger mucosus]|uniref:Alkaline phosphatase n=1 Tax=Salipiger mucosus DSM 16094 TaxID=1123237 RepID=S9RNL9_9RHOB|nr:calcium-binding protein [Salipiger mucosus]EPX79665.1 Alkaline phosphatase [Salipiger mucosus DSM 16094]
MATTFDFEAAIGIGRGVLSSSRIPGTISATIDDGAIDPGDAVLIATDNQRVLDAGGVSDATGYFLGSGSFDGNTGHVFGDEPTVSGNTDFLIVFEEENAVGGATGSAIVDWANDTSQQNLGSGALLPGNAIAGTSGADVLDGTSDGDLMLGYAGNDTIRGAGGSDAIEGGPGDDDLFGGSGDDVLIGGSGANAYDGGAGTDVADYANAPGRVLVDLQSDLTGAGFLKFFDAGFVQGDTYESIEYVVGGAYADNLRGDSGDNVLVGGGVSDRLYGRAGDDLISGNDGADALYGNLGADIMTGGNSTSDASDDRRDRFIYFQPEESPAGANERDIITDFVAGEDRIELSRFDADTTQGFKQAFEWIGDAAFTEAGQLGYRQELGMTIVQADFDGDGAADFEIALLGTLDLTADDFLI